MHVASRLPSALILLLIAVPAFPQSASAPAKGIEQEVVTLTPFTVSAASQAGYGATETMSGSRLPTKIKDLPYNVGVITSEFFDDFVVFDNSTIFNGGVVTQDQDNGGGYSVRGINNNGQLYNGFWLPAGTPIPNALRDRVEILYGPSAGAYGQTAPGGIVNIISKKPKTKPLQVLRYTGGDYDLMDARLESTGPLSSKTSYYLLLNHYERTFDRAFNENQTRTAALSLEHRFDEKSSLNVEFVQSEQRNDSPSNRVPYLFNSLTQQVQGIAFELKNEGGIGPSSYRDVDNRSLFATYAKRINSTLSTRVGAYYYERHQARFNDVDLTAYDPDPTHARTDPYSSTFFGLARFRDPGSSYTAPGYRIDNDDGGGAQADLAAHYWLFDGKVENRTLLTVDFATIYNYRNRRAMPVQVTLNTDGSPRVNADGSLAIRNAVDSSIVPVRPAFAGDTGYWVPVINPFGPQISNNTVNGLPTDIFNVPDPFSKYLTPFSLQRTRTDALGIMLRQQATILKRLLLFASVRFDTVRYHNNTVSQVRWSIAGHPEWAQYVAASYAALNTGPAVTQYSARAWTP